MTTLMGFPSPTELDARTPSDRDRAIDVIRITALIGVVTGHTVMAISTIRGGVLIWDNLLTTSVGFQALTWIFQIMPLFFFAGTAACVTSWQPGSSWGAWLMKRCTRLFRPVFYYLAFWAVALMALYPVLPQHVYEPVAGISIQLLWFLGVYVLVLAAMPVLSRITTPARLVAGVVGVYTLAAVIDAARLHWAVAPLGYLNMAVWLIPGMFGVVYRRGLLTGRAALATAAAMLAVNIALLNWGPYELSLVGIEGMRLPNMSPPSLLLAGHAIVLSALAIAAAPAINRWARRPRVWWFTAIGNSGAMTLYLWHMPALLAVHVLFDSFGHPRYPGRPDFLAVTFEQLFIMIGVVAVLFVALRPLENNPLPGWDGASAAPSVRRSRMVGTLLCVAGAALLAAVKWGLKDDGLVCVAVMLAALLAARLLTVQVPAAGITGRLRKPGRPAATAASRAVPRAGAGRVSAPNSPLIPLR
ncbi:MULTISPECIES: acyltransferase family protein [Mycobacterium]|uniref:acyltransferase family protein n=1 Tax=Mycobacterium TaxID=1763 RepID=UPI000A76673E|nr:MULTISPECIES: acyltransferase [Mycobacterium]MDP7731007.1 acyltransferase [Mycobacterium sp. TY813]